MKAIVQTKYGQPDVLQLKEVEKPTPKENEVLIRIVATAVTSAHTAMRKGPIYGRPVTGLRGPKNQIPGTDFAGVIEEVGRDVTLFEVGDQLFGALDTDFGAYAEYKTVPEDGVLAEMPVNMSFVEATAVIEGALTALPFLRDAGKIKSGQKVLINGASGAVGTAAVQLAKYYGAEVTGVSSSANVDMVKSLGADQVIDYKKEDFTQNGQTYDIIFDTVSKSTFSRSKNSLTPEGIYLNTALGLPILLNMLWTSMIGSKTAILSLTGLRSTSERRDDLIFIKELVETGKLKSVIDRCYPLEEIVEAHTYVETGHKKGNVVIVMEPNESNPFML